MIKSVYLKYKNEETIPWLLVFITVVSWFMFPLMLKQLNPLVFHIGFAICLLLVSAVVAITLTRNQIALQPLHKMMLVCWISYLLALLLATLESASTYSLAQWCILFAKFLFFAFLLLYMNEKYIVATLRIYANLMVFTVFFALVAIFLHAKGVPPFTTVDLDGRLGYVYFGAYIVHIDFICSPTPIFRMQGLSEEPGTYAFTLLPAFFWLLIAEKAYVRSAVIVLGLMFSMSLGAGLFLLILLPIMAGKYPAGYKVLAFFLSAVCVIGLMYVVSNSCINRHFENMDASSVMAKNEDASSARATVEACVKEGSRDNRTCKKTVIESLSTSTSGKIHSFQDRVDGILAAWSYLRVHVMGTGTALGMSTVKNSISVGYAIAILEAGVVGGIFYLCLFAIMGWLALKTIITSNNDFFDERVRIVVALSICTVLVMGTQRMQPDLSFWHMWIYAMWFYLLQKKDCAEAERTQI